MFPVHMCMFTIVHVHCHMAITSQTLLYCGSFRLHLIDKDLIDLDQDASSLRVDVFATTGIWCFDFLKASIFIHILATYTFPSRRS